MLSQLSEMNFKIKYEIIFAKPFFDFYDGNNFGFRQFGSETAIFENVRLDFPEPDNKAPVNNDVPVFAILVIKTLPVVKPVN